MDKNTFTDCYSPLAHEELMTRLAAIRHVALDMDGTIYMGSTLFPWTKAFLAKLDALGIGYSFLTNNPSKNIDDYLHKLEGMGIGVPRERMYTSALATTSVRTIPRPNGSFCSVRRV